MECQIRKNAAGCKSNDTFLGMTTFLDTQMLFDFRKVVIQFKKNVFNSLKVFIRKTCSFAKSVHSQKVFIQFTLSCHLRKCVQFIKIPKSGRKHKTA